MDEIEKEVKWVVNNWEKIPDEDKVDIKPYPERENVKGVSKEGHFVVLLLDRQKPSVESFYDFDEERIGINRFGEIIWGFDSGCSCPTPWDDSYSECYERSKTWKEFAVNLKDFDKGVIKECLNRIKEIKSRV